MKGTWLSTTPSIAKTQVLVTTAYASQKRLKVGDTLTINKVGYKIVGLVNPTLTGDVSDVYFSISNLQTLSTNTRPHQRGARVGRQREGRQRRRQGHQEGAARRDGPHVGVARRSGDGQSLQRAQARQRPRRRTGRRGPAGGVPHRRAADALECLQARA